MKLPPDTNLIVKCLICALNLQSKRGGNTVMSDLDEKCGVSGVGRQNG